jgi:hypothetical protein
MAQKGQTFLYAFMKLIFKNLKKEKNLAYNKKVTLKLTSSNRTLSSRVIHDFFSMPKLVQLIDFENSLL